MNSLWHKIPFCWSYVHVIGKNEWIRTYYVILFGRKFEIWSAHV